MSDVLSKHSIFVSLLLVLRFMLFLQSLCFARVVPSTSVFCLCCSFNPCVLLALFLRSLCVACVFPSIPVVFFFCSCAVPSIPVFCLCCSFNCCVFHVLFLQSLCFACVVPSIPVFCFCCSFNPCVLLVLFPRSLCFTCVAPPVPVLCEFELQLKFVSFTRSFRNLPVATTSVAIPTTRKAPRGVMLTLHVPGNPCAAWQSAVSSVPS